MWPAADGFVMWQDGEAHTLGVGMDQISAYVDSRLSGYLPLSGGTLLGGLSANGRLSCQGKVSVRGDYGTMDMEVSEYETTFSYQGDSEDLPA
jgi:hypothetical protein